MDYLSARETAARWGVSLRQVQRLLHENRIPGAKKCGVSWLIPAHSSKPTDPRRGLRPEPLPTPLPLPATAVENFPSRPAPGAGEGDCALFPLLYIHNGDLDAAYARCGGEAERKLLEAGLAYFRNELPAAKALTAAAYQSADRPQLRLGCCLLRGLCAMYEGDVRTWNEVMEQLSQEKPCLQRDLADTILNAAMHGRRVYPDWLERGDYSCLPPPFSRWPAGSM